MRVLQVGRTARFTLFRQGSRNGACALTGGAGRINAYTKGVTGLTHLNEVVGGWSQIFTRPLPCGELRSRFVGFGDREQQAEAEIDFLKQGQ